MFLKKNLEKELFFNALLDESLTFKEVMSFYQYSIEETIYTTMHKTKGTGIDNVLVVLDSFFWNKYSFDNCFSPNEKTEKDFRSQKLLYVACSRTKRNLICVKLVEDEREEEILKNAFPCHEKINLL